MKHFNVAGPCMEGTRRRRRPDPGLRQIEGNLTSLGLDHGWLVVFDRRTDATPVADRTRFFEATTPTRGLAVTALHA